MDLIRIFQEADDARNQGNVEQARSLYRRILQDQPDNARAAAELRVLEQLELKKVEILEMIKDADKFFAQGDFVRAVQGYTQSMAHAAQAGITGYHVELEQKQRQAKQLEFWTASTQQKLTEAQALTNQHNPTAVLNLLSLFLKGMPEDDVYRSLRERVEAEWRKSKNAVKGQDLLVQANEAFVNQDFDETIQILIGILPDANINDNVQGLLQDANKHLGRLTPIINDAQKAFDRKEWADASAYLGDAKAKYPKSQIWRRLWLRVAVAHGRAELEAGKVACVQRNFKEAIQRFERANEAFKTVSESGYEKHQDALEGLAAAADLIGLSHSGFQAAVDLERGNREAALSALNLAKGYLKEVGDKKREYPAVAVSINSLYQQVESELESIRTTEADLARAEKQLATRDLKPARDLFSKALTALLEGSRQRAELGLQRVEREITDFEQAMENGSKTPDSKAALKFFKAAYERWPGGPKVLEAYMAALIRAAEQALTQNDVELVASLCQQVQEINPENLRAKQLLERLSLDPQVSALVMRAQARLAENETPQTDLQAVLVDLDEMNKRCLNQSVFQEQISGMQAEVKRRVDTAVKGDQTVQRAEAALRQGQVQEAIKIYDEALEVFGASGPQLVQKRVEQLRSAWKTLEEALGVLPDLLRQIQAGYLACLDKRDFEDLQKLLHQADLRLGRVKQVQEQVKGLMLPRGLEEAGKQADDLRKRVTLVKEALLAPQVREALSQVRTQSKLLGSDAVLARLEIELQKQVKAELPRLLEQADAELRTGRIKQSLELLRLAAEIEPANVQIKNRLSEVEEHSRLLDEIQNAKHSFAIAQNSPVEALKALRSGLDALRTAPIEVVGVDLAGLLQQLFELAAKDDNMGLGQENNHGQAQHLISELGKVRNNWAMREAAQLADAWLARARDIALDGVVASAAQLGNLLQAYSAASTKVRMNPFDERLIRQESDIRVELIAKQVSSANKRLEWAREALDHDNFETALKHINNIEQEFFTPVEIRFPGLLEGVDSVDAVRKQLHALQPRIELGQALYAETSPILVMARVLFQQNKLREANLKLEELLKFDLSQAPKLIETANDLRGQLKKAQQDDAMQRMDEGLAGVLGGLKVTRSVTDVRQLLSDLDELEKKIEWILLTADKQSEFMRVRAQVNDEITRLGSGELYKNNAQEALNQGRYQQAVSSFRKALAITSVPREKLEIEELLDHAEKLLDNENKQQAALESGQAYLEQAEYDLARFDFLKARGLGVDVKLVLVLVSAGSLYKEADEMRKQASLEEALYALLDAQEKVENFLLASQENLGKADGLSLRCQIVAEELDGKIKKLLTRINKSLAGNEEVRKKITQARQTYNAGKYNEAEGIALSVLESIPDQLDARVIQAVCTARNLYEAGRDDEALGLLDQLREIAANDPLVMPLRRQIQARSTASNMLNQAVNLAKNGEFQSARQALLKAAELNSDPRRYEEAQRVVNLAQQDWERRTILPIQDALRDEDYAEALSRCKQALVQVTAGEFLAVLKNLLEDGVSRWAEKDYKAYSQRLAEISTESGLLNLRNEIDATLSRDPAPGEKLIKRLELLRNAVVEKSLRIRVDDLKPIIDRGSWDVVIARLGVLSEESDKAGTWNLTAEIDQLKREITTKQMDEAKEKARNIRETALHSVKQSLAESKSLNELIRVQEILDENQRQNNLTHDDEFNRLAQEIREIIELFDKNEQLKSRVRDFMRQKRYVDASREFRALLDISPLQVEALDKLRELVKVLSDADGKLKEKHWESALKDYEQACSIDTALKDTLAVDMDVCKENLSRELLVSVETCLAALPAQLTQAEQWLDRVKSWLTAQNEAHYNQLVDWLESQKKVEEAAQLLLKADSLPEDAINLLNDAGRIWPDNRSRDNLVPWINLASALRSWRSLELIQTKDTLNKLPQSMFALPRLQALTRDIELVEEIDEGLKTHNYLATARSARKLQDVSSDPMSIKRSSDISRVMLNEFNSARELSNYKQAQQIGSALILLLPENEQIRQQVAFLEKERNEKYQLLIISIEQHLRIWELDQAEMKLNEVQKLVVEPGGTVDNIKLRLLDMVAKDRQLNLLLDEFEMAFGKGDWQGAISPLTAAREIVSGYPRVDQKVVTLRTKLFDLAQVALEGKDFKLAEDLRSKSEMIKVDDETIKLRTLISEKLSEYILEQKKRAQSALQAWNLDKAEIALSVIRSQVPDDRGLVELERKKNEILEYANFTFDLLKLAWAKLRSAENMDAKRHFEMATLHAPDLEEIQLWLSYATRLQDGIQAVYGEDFHKAAQSLQAAAQALQLTPGKLLPSVFQGELTIKDRRREAIYHANRLVQYVLPLEDLYDAYLELELDGKDEASFEKLDALLKGAERFKQSLYMMEPPADFSIDALPVPKMNPSEPKNWTSPVINFGGVAEPPLKKINAVLDETIAIVSPKPTQVEFKSPIPPAMELDPEKEPIELVSFAYSEPKTEPVKPAGVEEIQHEAAQPAAAPVIRQVIKPEVVTIEPKFEPKFTSEPIATPAAELEQPLILQPKAEEQKSVDQDAPPAFTWNSPTLSTYDNEEEL
ncbi:MAG: hypothetical protein WCK35_10025 [Chloroflexota bacterium]